MNTRMIAIALLMASVSAPLIAQETAPRSPAEAPMAPTGEAPPAPHLPVSQPSAAYPNTGESTDTIPSAADTIVPADPSVPANPTTIAGSAANPVVVGGNMTPPPSPSKDYPLCTKTITDSCINRSEAKKARTR